MGAGIAQVALEAGCEVVLYDVDDAAIEGGRERIRDGLTRRARKLDLDPVGIDAWVTQRLDRLRHVPTVDGLADEADLVIESALEDLALKQTIFRTLDAVADGDVILATNTSALSVAEIAEATRRPDRVRRPPLLQSGTGHGPRRGRRAASRRPGASSPAPTRS